MQLLFVCDKEQELFVCDNLPHKGIDWVNFSNIFLTPCQLIMKDCLQTSQALQFYCTFTMVLDYLIQVVWFNYWNFDFKLFWVRQRPVTSLGVMSKMGANLFFFKVFSKSFFYLLISPPIVCYNVQRIFHSEIIKSAIKELIGKICWWCSVHCVSGV